MKKVFSILGLASFLAAGAVVPELRRLGQRFSSDDWDTDRQPTGGDSGNGERLDRDL